MKYKSLIKINEILGINLFDSDDITIGVLSEKIASVWGDISKSDKDKILDVLLDKSESKLIYRGYLDYINNKKRG